MEEKQSFVSPSFIAAMVFILIISGVVLYYILTLPHSSETPEEIPNVFADMPTPTMDTEKDSPAPTEPTVEQADADPAETLPDYLTPDQAAKLESWGVNVDELPKTIEGETEACLIDAVGETRAQEIVGGSEPSAWEMIKASRCF